MGWIDPARMSPVLAEAAFQADIGELVQAESRHGLHLIRVEAERCAVLAMLPAHSLLHKSPVLVPAAFQASAWCSCRCREVPCSSRSLLLLLHSACF